MKRKFLSFVLSLALMLSLMAGLTLPVSAETVSGTCGDDLTWTLDTETGLLTISGEGEMYDWTYDWTNPTRAPWYDYRDYIKTIQMDINDLNYKELGDYDIVLASRCLNGIYNIKNTP